MSERSHDDPLALAEEQNGYDGESFRMDQRTGIPNTISTFQGWSKRYRWHRFSRGMRVSWWGVVVLMMSIVLYLLSIDVSQMRGIYME
jgi:hypothetical protein